MVIPVGPPSWQQLLLITKDAQGLMHQHPVEDVRLSSFMANMAGSRLMAEILLKALAYVFIILLGYILKVKHFFAPGDQRVVANIVMNITFPAAIITNFAALKLDRSLYSIIVLGVILNLGLIALGWLFPVASRITHEGSTCSVSLDSTLACSHCLTSRISWGLSEQEF